MDRKKWKYYPDGWRLEERKADKELRLAKNQQESLFRRVARTNPFRPKPHNQDVNQ